MTSILRTALPVIGAVAIASTVAAQDSYDAVYDVAIFERVAVGDVEITPIGIIEDSRCFDPDLCFRSDRLVVSTILHGYDGRLREIPLRLGELTPVNGGALLLTNAGTPPVRNGAIQLKRYSLDIEFVPGPLN
ncbi:hypothetical protein N9D37_00735 [Erythrobacter sp.]|nr:hypothetical protein [Erythrobacter sp.]